MNEPSEQWTEQQHQEWRHTFQQLRDEREILAGVTTRFVLEGEWDLATKVAREWQEAEDAVRAHSAKLPNRARQRQP